MGSSFVTRDWIQLPALEVLSLSHWTSSFLEAVTVRKFMKVQKDWKSNCFLMLEFQILKTVVGEVLWGRGAVSKVPPTSPFTPTSWGWRGCVCSVLCSVFQWWGRCPGWAIDPFCPGDAVMWWGRKSVCKREAPLGPWDTVVQRLINTLKCVHNRERGKCMNLLLFGC